ncbi:MAG TPA: GAF domain-containing sensor histidine kinase [Gaiellaceae bacterium]|nr:GAF domain-containing sensor histidine kinase [Gaiellaceae bacterium]
MQTTIDSKRRRELSERAKRRLAWSIWGVLGCLLAAVLLLRPLHRDAALLLAVAPPFTTVGAFIAARRPANPIGWLFLGFGAAIVMRSFGTQYAYHGFVSEPGSLPGAGWIGSVGVHAWHPSFTFLVFVLLLFPDGRLPSRRWRPIAWLSVVTALVGFASGMLESSFLTDEINLPFVEPPVARTDAVAGPVFGVFLVVNAALLVAAMAAFGFRLRRARGEERLQLQWFGYSVVVVIAALPISLLLTGDGRAFAAVTPVVPLAAAFAVLKYGLYDIDVVVNRSLVYAALTAFVLAVYAALIGLTEAVAGRSGGAATSLLAAAVVAVAIAPLRDRVQRTVDGMLYGERRDPYRVLSRLGTRLQATMAPEEVLPSVVDTVADSLRLPYAAVVLAGRVEAECGTRSDREERLPLTYRGDDVGELVLGRRSGEDDFSSSDRRLLADLARQAGVAAHAVSLTRALQRSRERLVTAREEERRRLRRDLHDGLGPALAGITLQLDGARSLLRRDPVAARETLEELRRQTQTAIADIRRLVYDLRPPTLDELGLLGALREQAARLEGELRVTVNGPRELPPLPAAVEVAAYRIALEAVTNAARHANATSCTVNLSVNGGVRVDVRDDGDGLPAAYRAGVGITSMRERAAELGGACIVRRAEPTGTAVEAQLPVVLP